MGSWGGEAGALGRQLGAVARHGHAAPLQVGRVGLVGGLEFERGVGSVDFAHAIGEVELGGGAALHADGLTGQILQALDAAGSRHHHPLAVIEGGGGKTQPIAARRIPAQGEGGVAGEQVHLAAGQGRKPFAGIEVAVIHLGWIAKQRCRHGLAHIHIQAAVAAVWRYKTETGQLAIHPTHQGAAAFDGGQLLALHTAVITGASHQGQGGKHRNNGSQPGKANHGWRKRFPAVWQ